MRVCVLCGKNYKLLGEYGNNPWPLAFDGRCCDKCEREKVLPARLSKSSQRRIKYDARTIHPTI